MQTFCPKCGVKLGADETLIGKTVECGKCGIRFTVAPSPQSDLIGGTMAPIGVTEAPKSPPGGIAQEKAAVAPAPAPRPAAPAPAAKKAEPTPVAPQPVPAPAAGSKPALPKPAAGEGGEKCPKCGAALAPNAVLCTQCGTFLKEEKPAKGKGKDKGKSKGLETLKTVAQIVGVIVVILVLVGVKYGGKIFRIYKKEQRREQREQREEARERQRQAQLQAQQQAEQPPGAPGAPGPGPAPPGPPSAPPGDPSRFLRPGAPPTPTPVAAAAVVAVTLPRIDLSPINPQELEAVAKLPANDPPPDPSEGSATKTSPLVPYPSLLQTVYLKGPPIDRYQPGKSPQILPTTKLITLRFTWKHDRFDQAFPLSAETLRASTEAGPGVFYGCDFGKYVSFANWQPKGSTPESSSVLETVQLVDRRVSDYTTDMLAAGKLLARAEYGRWFQNIVGLTMNEGLLAVSAANQHFTDKGMQTETGAFFCPDNLLNVHLLIPVTARTVQMQFQNYPALFVPFDALAAIPTTAQPDPTPFVNATIEKAGPLLASEVSEQVIGGARLVIEAGNMENLKPASFKTWSNCVTQLLAHANADCRAAGVETILRSRRVDAKLRCQFLAQVIKDPSPVVRRRAAELISERPTLLETAFKEGMENLQALLSDTNTSVRAAAMLSNCRMAMLGDDSGWDFQKEFVEKGLMDPAPSIRAALLKSLPELQLENDKVAPTRLAQLLKSVRLNLFDPNETVRVHAAKAVLAIRAANSGDVVRDALQQVPDKTADLFALASLELPAGTDKDIGHRLPALLDASTQRAILPTLQKLLDAPEPRTRQGVARLLGAFQPEVANEALAVAATNTDLGVRLAVFSAFNAPQRGLPPPLSIYADGLNDPEPRIQGATLGLLDEVLADPNNAAPLASNVAARVVSPVLRLQVAKRIAAPAATNTVMRFALTSFLNDTDDNVWRTAATPWTNAAVRFTWKEIEPVWTQMIQQPATARRVYAFFPLQLATPEEWIATGTNLPPKEAIAEASKLLGDPDGYVRERALLFVAPHRALEHTEPIRKMLTEAKAEMSGAVKNQMLVMLAKPSSTEDLTVVDRIRPATEQDLQRERAALASAAHAQPQPGPGGPPKANFTPTDYRVKVPATSLSGVYLLTQWATSSNPAANAAGNYLLQVAQTAFARSWLLPTERAIYTQALKKLGDLPTVSSPSRTALGQFETRFPRGASTKMLSEEQTRGATESIESLVSFLAPKKKPMLIATFRSPGGALLDIWYNADETIPERYPADAAPNAPDAWKFQSKAEGWRIEPIDRELLARLEWAAANAPKDKLREALVKIGATEGDLVTISQRVALEGLVMLADQGDGSAEAEAVKLGWLKM